MADDASAHAADVIDDLPEHSGAFDFFQAVQLLERLQAQTVNVGEMGPLENEALRFRSNISMDFPPADIEKIGLIEPRSDERPIPDYDRVQHYQLIVNFFGLYGPTSPLPDFFIGAHAEADGHTILTRDPMRTYFPSVKLLAPRR